MLQHCACFSGTCLISLQGQDVHLHQAAHVMLTYPSFLLLALFTSLV